MTNLMQVVLSLEIGGSEKLVLDLVRKTDKDLFNVCVCCVEKGGELQKEFESLGIPIYFLHKKDTGYDIKVIGRLAKIIQEQRINVIHTHHLFTLMYVLPAAVISNCLSIVHTEHSYLYFKESRKYSLIAKLLFKGVKKIVCVCDDVADYIVNFMEVNSSRVETILNGVDIDIFYMKGKIDVVQDRKEVGLSEGDFVVGTVGRMVPVKNHKGLLDAFKKAIKQANNLQLVIVGDGHLRDNLEKLASELGIYSRVKFLGYRRNIPDLLNIMDVFVLPSFSEGLSLTLLEAMACQKPVIASDVGGNRGVVQNGVNGILVSPNDVDEIADVIMRLYRNKEMRVRIAQSGKETVAEKYSLLNMVKTYQDVYKCCNKGCNNV